MEFTCLRYRNISLSSFEQVTEVEQSGIVQVTYDVNIVLLDVPLNIGM